MATASYVGQLKQLLKIDLTSPNKKKVHSGYQSLIRLLSDPRITQNLFGYHELIFQCISSIILTPNHRHFDDKQLSALFDAAMKSRTLSMSQNHVLDLWYRNVEDRLFEAPEEEDDHRNGPRTQQTNHNDMDDDQDDDEDDDEWLDETTDTEDEFEVGTRTIVQRTFAPVSIKPLPSTHSKPNVKSNKRPVSPVLKPPAEMDPRPRQTSGSELNSNNGSTSGRRNEGREQQQNENSRPQRPQTEKRVSLCVPDFRATDDSVATKAMTMHQDTNHGNKQSPRKCFKCDEEGHIAKQCPKHRQAGSAKGTQSTTPAARSELPSSTPKGFQTKPQTDIVRVPTDHDKDEIQRAYNEASKLMNNSQSIDKGKESLHLFCKMIRELHKHHGEHLVKIFVEKEVLFYSIVCHVAQHSFLFDNNDYQLLFEQCRVILPNRYKELNANREKFTRQRPLKPFDEVKKHIYGASQMDQPVFNDFQEHIARAKPPIPREMFDGLKHLLRSKVHIHTSCLDHFVNKILFESKRSLFSDVDLEELKSCLDVRARRVDLKQNKPIWKERLNLMNQPSVSVHLEQWISELGDILHADALEKPSPNSTAVDHGMWYFLVLTMTSCCPLTQIQYQTLLKHAIESALFNNCQKFYLQFYLDQGQAPIPMKELNEVEAELERDDSRAKRSAYQQLQTILARKRPVMTSNKSGSSPSTTAELADNQSEQSDSAYEAISMIDNHIRTKLITLIQKICSDKATFSTKDMKAIVDHMLYQSSIVRPLSTIEETRLKSYESNFLTLNDLEAIRSFVTSDWSKFISMIQERSVNSNDSQVVESLVSVVIDVFSKPNAFTLEQCNELKSLIHRQIPNRVRCDLINKVYHEYRGASKSTSASNPIPKIDAANLNALLGNILRQDYQAHLEFLHVLDHFSENEKCDEISFRFEVVRCLLSGTILIICETDYSAKPNMKDFHQQMKMMIDQRPEFFSTLFTKQQFQLVQLRLAQTVHTLDALIESIQRNANQQSLGDLMNFIRTNLKEKDDFDKIIGLIISTFEHSCLSTAQSLVLSQTLVQHPNLITESSKNRLQFLIDLLQLDMHQAPKILLQQVEKNIVDGRVLENILAILKSPHGAHAPADWITTIVQILKALSNRNEYVMQLQKPVQQSSMLQQAPFKNELASYWQTATDTSKVEHKAAVAAATATTTTDQIDHATVHRELFGRLESNNPDDHRFIVHRLRQCLLDEKLPPIILLPKYIQALEKVIKNPAKFSQVSPHEWSELIAKNRGKIFTDDGQCDRLLLILLFVDSNTSVNSLGAINQLLYSRNGKERQSGYTALLSLLKKTKIRNDQDEMNHLPTIADDVFQIISNVIHNQRFSDSQVRQCFEAARLSWLLTAHQRQELQQAL